MRFMVTGTWTSEQRNDMYKQRAEKGRMLPENTKLLSEWMEAAGGRVWALVETDDVMALLQWATAWNNLADYEFVPVVEVLDDKGMKYA